MARVFYWFIFAILCLTLLFSLFIKNFKLKKQLIFLLWLINLILTIYYYWPAFWPAFSVGHYVNRGFRDFDYLTFHLEYWIITIHFILSVIPFLASGLDLYQWKSNKNYIKWACFPIFIAWLLLLPISPLFSK